MRFIICCEGLGAEGLGARRRGVRSAHGGKGQDGGLVG
jgi:hypothetical protein